MLFASQSFLVLLSAFLILLFKDDREQDHSTNIAAPRVLGFSQVILVRRVFAGLSNFGISITLFYFLEPTLALKLSEDFGFTQL